MNFLNPIFLTLAISGIIFVLTGKYMLKFPPKKINGIYGYRTPASKKTQERWDFSQIYASKEMIKWGFMLILSSIPGLFSAIDEGIGAIIGITILILFVILLILRTERALKEKFGSL